MSGAAEVEPNLAADLSGADLAGVAGRMADAGHAPSGRLSARLLAGGRSNLTYRLDDEDGGAWVMRTPPRAGRTPSAHDVVRELRIIRGLAGTGVPVAEAVVGCEDESVIGLPFAVAGFVAGETVQSRDQLAALDPAVRSAALEAVLAALAALHRVDVAAPALAGIGRPDGYAARQLRRWAGQWEIVGEGLPEAVRADAVRLVERLGTGLPAQASTGVVHGDYRIDNTLLRLHAGSRPGAEVAAIVDWELCTLGDPVADVALMAVYRHPAFDLVLGAPSAWASDLLPDAAALAAGYERHGGVPLVDWEAHLALGYLKIAVIAAGIEHRRRAGAAAGLAQGTGDGFATAGEAVGPFLAAGLAHRR